jgi:hypothetical protein
VYSNINLSYICDKDRKFIKLDKKNIPEYLYNHLNKYQGKEINVSSNFGKKNVLKTDQSSTVVNEIPNDTISVTEIEFFFNKLVFAVNQPNERELFKVIELTMKEDENINFYDKRIEIKEVYTHI